MFLVYCIDHQAPECLEFILRLSPNRESSSNLLHVACKGPQDKIQVVKTILRFDSAANINAQDTYGNTPIHLAAINDLPQTLKKLMRQDYASVS